MCLLLWFSAALLLLPKLTHFLKNYAIQELSRLLLRYANACDGMHQ